MRINKTIILAAGAAGLALSFASAAEAGTCRDPWITQAIREVTGREPNGSNESGECTYTQYGGGRWSSYPELKGYVQQRLKPVSPFGQLTGGNVQYQTVRVPVATYNSLPKKQINGATQVLYQGQWWKLIGMDGSSMKLVGPDGGS